MWKYYFIHEYSNLYVASSEKQYQFYGNMEILLCPVIHCYLDYIFLGALSLLGTIKTSHSPKTIFGASSQSNITISEISIAPENGITIVGVPWPYYQPVMISERAFNKQKSVQQFKPHTELLIRPKLSVQARILLECWNAAQLRKSEIMPNIKI